MLGHADEAAAAWPAAFGTLDPHVWVRAESAVSRFRALPNYACMGHCLHTASIVLATAGRLEESARCLGVVDVIRSRLGMVMAPYEDRRMWIDRAGLHRLDEPRREAAEAAGRAMEPEAGIDWVLARLAEGGSGD